MSLRKLIINIALNSKKSFRSKLLKDSLISNTVKKRIFFSVKQKDFFLEEALLKEAAFPFIMRNYKMDNYKKIISEFVFSVKSGLKAI